MRLIKKTLVILLIAVLQNFSQTLELPRLSPKAKVVQNIGLSRIEINYCRPSVRGRKIWGKLVPYNNGIPFPWRAGANENTTIEFSDDVDINGNKIKAGIYGFHIIPSKDEWILIFNKEYKAWGSFFYDSKYDALRIKVKPVKNEFVESLEYGFNDFTAKSAKVYMQWEKLKIEFAISFNEKEIVLKDIRQQLLSLPGMGWEGPMEAAQFCLENNFNYEEALKWIDLSVSRKSNFQTKIIKVKLLERLDRIKGAELVTEDAINNSTEQELNLFGYELLNENKIEKALGVFKINIKRHPNSWNCYNSYADALMHNKKRNEAITNYKKALKLAPKNQKKRIEALLKGDE